MRFALILTSLLASVIASPISSHAVGSNNNIHKRDAASITAAITEISNNAVALNATLNKFTPNPLLNPLQALKIQKQTTRLSDSLISATSIASSSTPLNADDSFTVAAAILDFQPKIFSLLDNLQRREPVFRRAILGIFGVRGLVKKSLVQQKGLSAEFAAAVADKLAEPFKGAAPVISGQIGEAFDKAIAVFS